MSSIGSQVETLLAFVCAIAIVMLTALVVVWFTWLVAARDEHDAAANQPTVRVTY